MVKIKVLRKDFSNQLCLIKCKRQHLKNIKWRRNNRFTSIESAICNLPKLPERSLQMVMDCLVRASSIYPRENSKTFRRIPRSILTKFQNLRFTIFETLHLTNNIKSQWSAQGIIPVRELFCAFFVLFRTLIKRKANCRKRHQGNHTKSFPTKENVTREIIQNIHYEEVHSKQ